MTPPKNTASKSRQSAGSLPEGGKWVRIEIAPEKVGLNAGDKLDGFALTQFGGTVYWDKVGVSGRSDPATDPRRSFEAWRKERAGKDTPGVPADLVKPLKAGPAKTKDAKVVQKLRDYFLQNGVSADFFPSFVEVGGIRCLSLAHIV